ncbi:hypothetical protein [Rhizorhabdus histidinilytica]|uniref:hypothetical protein n=1 Tax=Rhizorhabdus histidinilytica TaxID=439228 RepID=UPI001ADCBB27|nr:hypothetical protein [Rhizorhabdus histidinilytica]
MAAQSTTSRKPTIRRKRTPDTGLLRPYRPRPADFREVYVRMGWEGLDEHFRTNWRCIRRWIIEQIAEDEAMGRIHLKAARTNWLAEHGERIRRQELRGSRRSDYVAGRRLRPTRVFDWGNIPPRAQMNLVLEEDMHGFTPPRPTRPMRVSDHARVRYLERVKGVDIEKLDAEILSPAMVLADDMGGGKVIMKTGHKAVVRDGVIVTVESKSERRKVR